MAFDRKAWLDTHLVPLITKTPPLIFSSPFWKTTGPDAVPDEVLVFLLAGHSPEPELDMAAWPIAVKRLLEEDGFRFDYLREELAAPAAGSAIKIFGGDGAPLYNEQGMVSCRLFRKEEDGVGLILQVGCKYQDHAEAKAAVAAFFGQWQEGVLELCQRFGAIYGQA